MISRQRRWQIKKVEEKKCSQCGKEAPVGTRCGSCSKKQIKYRRNQYRTKNNIPLDAPLDPRGRPRNYK